MEARSQLRHRPTMTNFSILVESARFVKLRRPWCVSQSFKLRPYVRSIPRLRRLSAIALPTGNTSGVGVDDA